MIDARDRRHDLLAQCGEALWGSRWQSDMAEALGVSDRTVRRWVAGERIPAGVWADLIRLTLERSDYLDILADDMRSVGGGA